MIWLVLGSIILCLVFYYYCIKPLDYWIKRGVKQGTPAWLLGDNINIMLRRESFAQAIVRYCNQNPGGRWALSLITLGKNGVSMKLMFWNIRKLLCHERTNVYPHTPNLWIYTWRVFQSHQLTIFGIKIKFHYIFFSIMVTRGLKLMFGW